MKTLHITNGDSAVDLLKRSGIQGEFLPWRDVLHEGPVPAGLDFQQLCRERAGYIISRGWGDPENIQHTFQHTFDTLARCEQWDRIMLWFEHDLYDQLQLLQILSELALHPDIHPRLSLVQTDHYIGASTVDDIERYAAMEQLVTQEQLELAAQAWQAFRQPTPTAWCGLLNADTGALPWLGLAVERMLEEFPDCRDGLTRTQRQAMLAVVDGIHQPGRIFGFNQQEEERQFMGDLSFFGILHQLMNHQPALLKQTEGPEFGLSAKPEQRLCLTPDGESVLEGDASARPFDQGISWWIGGTELSSENRWYWNPATRELNQHPCA